MDIKRGRMDLKIKVVEIKGNCPVYETEDSFKLIDGYKLTSNKPVCMHSLASIMPYHVALSNDIPPSKIGLGKAEKAYVQCLDPCEYTGGGTVLLEITKEK